MKMKISNTTDQEIDGWIGCNPSTQLDFGLRLIPKDDKLPNILAMLDIDECKTLLTSCENILNTKVIRFEIGTGSALRQRTQRDKPYV